MDKTASGVLKRLKNEIPAKYNTENGGYIHDILAAVAIEFEAAYIENEKIALKNMIATATGEDLDELMDEVGYKRKRATYAEGHVIITGENDSVVNEGDLVAADRVLYEVTETATIVDGSVTVPVRAVKVGSSGNAVAGAINYFPVTLPGITSVTNTEALTGGTNDETDEEFRQRYWYFLDNPAASGNEYEYEQWAREVDGVGYSKCYKIWNGPGTVKVVICTSELEPASETLVNDVAQYIEARRPIGATVTVVSAESIPVNISAVLVYDSSYSIESIKTQYTTALTEYFKTVGFTGGILPYTKIGALLQEIPGVEYYESLLVNDGTENVVVDGGQVAVIGGVDLA